LRHHIDDRAVLAIEAPHGLHRVGVSGVVTAKTVRDTGRQHRCNMVGAVKLRRPKRRSTVRKPASVAPRDASKGMEHPGVVDYGSEKPSSPRLTSNENPLSQTVASSSKVPTCF